MEFPDDTEDYGSVTVSGQGQVTIPKEARQALGFDGTQRLYFFGSPSRRVGWLVRSNRPGAQVAAYLVDAVDDSGD